MKYSVYVSSRNKNIQDLIFEDSLGRGIPVTWSRVYFKGLSKFVREIGLQYLGANISRKSQYYLAFRNHFSLTYRNPGLGFRELLMGYVASFETSNTLQTPLRLRTHQQNRPIWIARGAVADGIFSTSFGPDIEWDRLRFSKQYSFFVWDLGVNSSDSSFSRDILKTSEINIFPDIEKCLEDNLLFLKFWQLSDCSIYNGIFTLKDGYVYLTDSSHAIERTSWPTNKVLKIDDSTRIIEPYASNSVALDNAIFLGSNSSWYHFLVEVFPRFLMLPNSAVRDSTVIVRGEIPGSIKEVIGEFGFSNILSVNDGEKVDVANLITISDFRYRNPLEIENRKEDLHLVRNYFLNSLAINSPETNIYLKRGRNLFRPLFRQQRLENFLVANGFEVIKPEELSLKEQITIFANAGIVVSESGAALTNMLFMPPTSLVVEINPGNDPIKLWSRFANTLGLELIVVNGSSFRLFNSLTGIGMFKVNFSKFRELIELKLSVRRS